MASVDRGYLPDEPVLITTRCVMRVCAFERPEVKTEVRRYLSWWAPRTRVELTAWTVIDNHLHLLVSQDFPGHKKRTGIAAFLRNSLSAIARVTNGLIQSQGHLVERVYLSRRRTTPEEALASLAYILEHPVKHGVEGGIDAENSAGRLYTRSLADGVATAVTGMFFLRDPEARGAAMMELLRTMWADERWADSSRRTEVAREAIRSSPEVVDRSGWNKTIAVAVWAGAEAAKRAREAVLTAPQARMEFVPRSAPKVGAVVTIVMRPMPPRPMDSKRARRSERSCRGTPRRRARDRRATLADAQRHCILAGSSRPRRGCSVFRNRPIRIPGRPQAAPAPLTPPRLPSLPLRAPA